jgi:F-type H+-transporting ATPase subunit c
MIYFGLLGLAVGLGLPVAVIGAAGAMGRVGAAALDGIVRQPEISSRIQTLLILSVALIESLVIYCLLTFFLLFTKLPTFNAAQAAQIAGATPANAQPANP